MNEAERVSEFDLIKEGLASYWDAKYAIESFENRVQTIARNIFIQKLGDFKLALPQEEMQEESINEYGPKNRELGQVALGAQYWWDEGRVNVYVGLGWRAAEAAAESKPVSTLSISSNTLYVRNNILTALRKATLVDPQPNVSIDSRQSYEVTLWSSLPTGAARSELIQSLTNIFDCFVRWSKQSGGLRNAINGQVEAS